MKSKRDVWVILRNDTGPVPEGIAVKGVYDSAETAKAEFERLSEMATTEGSYQVVRSRRFVEQDDERTSVQSDTTTQGFPARPAKEPSGASKNLQTRFKEFTELLRNSRQDALPQLLGAAAESLVADALGARPAQGDARWDLELTNGDRVEVKTALLRQGSGRAPYVRLHSLEDFEWLALLIFRPDLSLEAAKLIPRQALSLYVRKDEHTDSTAPVSLRVTSSLLQTLGVQDIGS